MKRLFAIFAAFVLLGVIATGVAAQSGGAGYYDFETNVRVWQNLVVHGDIYARDDMTVTDELAVLGNLAVTGDQTASGDMVVSDFLRLPPGTTQVVSFDTVIAPAGSFHPISSTEDVGTSVVATATATAGDVVLLDNVGEFTITLTDTAPLIMTGATVLGPTDKLLMIFDGTSWVEVSNAANNDTPG